MKKGYLRNALIDLVEITSEELKHIFRDSGIMVLFIGAGLAYPILYGFVYRNEVLRNVPIAVVNESQTPLGREFVRKVDATPELKIAYKVNTLNEAKDLFAKGKVQGVVLVPSTFSDDINKGKQARIFAYSNVATMLYYRAVFLGINYVCLDMGKNIQVQNLVEKGLTAQQAEVSATPLLYEDHALYNPNSGFASFLLPAALILILQQTLVLGIGIAAGQAREENTYHQLIPYQRKYHGTMKIVFGKAFAYLIVYAFIGIYNLILVPHMFNLPHFLTLGTIVPLLLPFLLATIFFGMSISIFFWDREIPFLTYLVTSIPLLLLCGYSWPASNIHPFWKTISYFFPSTFGIEGFLKMNSMGATIHQIGFECFGLWLQAGIYFIFAFFVYRWQILQSEKKIAH
jgi:ABC-2 type transport system permease protein